MYLPSLARDGADTVWDIDTRYYTAQVALREVGLRDDVTPDQGCEALVLVFSMNKEDTFVSIANWIKANRIELDSFGVRICVANKYDIWK